jgi:hypothetical protein
MGLTWRKQLNNVPNKAYRTLWTCRSMFEKTWELKPRVEYWIYAAVLRPIVNYAATV